MANITLNPSSFGGSVNYGPLLPGLGFKLFIREEDYYGQTYDNDGAFENFETFLIHLLPGGLLSKSKALINTSNALTGSFSDNEFIEGTESVAGSYVFPLTHETMTLIFKHVFGNTTTLSNDLPLNGLGFMETYGAGSSTGYGDSHYTYYSGNRISSLTFNCSSAQSIITCSMNVIGKDEEILGYSGEGDFTATGNNFYNLLALGTLPISTVFPGWATELHLDDNTNDFKVPFYDFSLTIDNGLSNNDFINNSVNTTNIVKINKRNISGSFKMPYFHGVSNNSTKQFVTGYLAAGSFELEVVFNNEEDDKVFRINCPNIKFFDGRSPSSVDFTEASCNMSFKAFKNNNVANSELSVAYT